MNKDCVEIAVSVEYSREWGRRVCEGIAAYAQLQSGWHLTMFKNGLSNATALKRFDGFIWGISDERTARALKATGRPIIDLFGHDVSVGGITGVGVDHAACGRLAAQKFISHRFRNFAYFGWKDLTLSRRRRLQRIGRFVGSVPNHSPQSFCCAVALWRHAGDSRECVREVLEGAEAKPHGDL